MATIYTTYMNSNNDSPRLKMTVVTSSSTGGTATLKWTLYYITEGYEIESSMYKPYTVKMNGSTVKSGEYWVNGKSGSSYTIASGTKTYSKNNTTTRDITFSCSMDFDITWGWHEPPKVSVGTKSASGTYTIPKRTSYTVKFNANGGSGAPNAQTKSYDKTLTLSSTKPTRSGYTFKGWGLSASDTTKDYSAGGSYSKNASVTLYAIWSQNITNYDITYDGLGYNYPSKGSFTNTATSITISSTKPKRAYYTFSGWKKGSSSTLYQPGHTFTSNPKADIDLTAVWEPWTHTVTFNKNTSGVLHGTISGSVPSNLTWTQGEEYPTLPAGTLSHTSSMGMKYQIAGWMPNAAGTGSEFWGVGDDYNFKQNGGTRTLYAVWVNDEVAVKSDGTLIAGEFTENATTQRFNSGEVKSKNFTEGTGKKITSTDMNFLIYEKPS